MLVAATVATMSYVGTRFPRDRRATQTAAAASSTEMEHHHGQTVMRAVASMSKRMRTSRHRSRSTDAKYDQQFCVAAPTVIQNTRTHSQQWRIVCLEDPDDDDAACQKAS